MQDRYLNRNPVPRRTVPPRNRELWLALLAVLLISGLYLTLVVTPMGTELGLPAGVPQASDFVGHMLGVLGFTLMLMTETLYSLRKRSRLARWGRMSEWLSFHIFTGIVGPFLVLLHSAWRLRGLAGIVLLLTGLIVLSGFIGRYIYTRLPRTADGLELADPHESHQHQAQRLRARQLLATWHAVHIPLGLALFTAAFVHILAALYYSTFLH